MATSMAEAAAMVAGAQVWFGDRTRNEQSAANQSLEPTRAMWLPPSSSTYKRNDENQCIHNLTTEPMVSTSMRVYKVVTMWL